jgi:hypothetical protein
MDHSNVLKTRNLRKQAMSARSKGILTVVAGFIWMMYLGSQFLVANIAPYIESYFPECSKADS